MTIVGYAHLALIAVWLAAVPLFVVIWRGLRRNEAMLKQIEALSKEETT